ncbi:hypothetical protein KBC55_04475 [Patescibacteria group bacterium]|nr:hypothetical protein [Patescibacteria group bacterium]
MNQEMIPVTPVAVQVPSVAPFTMKEAVLGGYALAKKYFIEMVALMAIVLALGTGGALTTDPFANGVAMLVNILAVYAYAVLALRAVRGQEIVWRDLIDLSPRAFGSLIIASLLSTLAISLGLGFLILPGLMAAAAFAFYTFVLVDHKLGPVEALKTSWKLATPALWTIVGMYVVFAVVAFLPLVFSVVLGLLLQLLTFDFTIGLIVGAVLGIPSVLWMLLMVFGAAFVGPFVHAWMYVRLGGK